MYAFSLNNPLRYLDPDGRATNPISSYVGTPASPDEVEFAGELANQHLEEGGDGYMHYEEVPLYESDGYNKFEGAYDCDKDPNCVHEKPGGPSEKAFDKYAPPIVKALKADTDPDSRVAAGVIDGAYMGGIGTMALGDTLLDCLPFVGTARAAQRGEKTNFFVSLGLDTLSLFSDGESQLLLKRGGYEAKGFATERLFARHFREHAAEWGVGNITKEGYLKRAKSLLESNVDGSKILGAVRADGDILRYNLRTNEFAVGAADGTIRTLFRPKRGLAYWLDKTVGL